MKTHGEIEAAVCAGVTRFEQEYMGRGPKDIHTHLLGDLLVIRLQGVLTAAEQQLVKSLSSEKGRDLLKQVRTHLIETARPVMQTMIQEITGVAVLSLHHDISTVTGEEVILFTIQEFTPPTIDPLRLGPCRSAREPWTSGGPPGAMTLPSYQGAGSFSTGFPSSRASDCSIFGPFTANPYCGSL